MADKKGSKKTRPEDGKDAHSRSDDEELIAPVERPAKARTEKADVEPAPPDIEKKASKGHTTEVAAHSIEEEDEMDSEVEKEAEKFRHKISTRPRTIAFTPSTVQRRTKTEIPKTWKPLVAGGLLLAIAFVGLVTSSNLFMTVNDSPLYAPDTGSIKGYVLNKDGERLAGARVALESLDIVRFTNSDGKYELKSIPKGEHVLLVTYPGYSTVRYPTMILGGTQLQAIGDTNFTLPRATVNAIDETKGTGPVKGTVTDNNLNPEMNVTVLDETTGKNDTTDRNGTFDLGLLSIGKRTLVLTKVGFYTQRVTFYATIGREGLVVRLTPGNGTRAQDMTSGIATLKGRVVDMQNVPIPYALIEVNGSAVQTDATGAFSVPIDAGEVTVTATAMSKTSTSVKTLADTSGGQHQLELQLSLDIPVNLPGDRDALRANLSTCGAAIVAMSIFMLFTAYTTIKRRRFWISVTGSLFGAVMMLVTFQYAIVLGLVAFGLLIFSKREFE